MSVESIIKKTIREGTFEELKLEYFNDLTGSEESIEIEHDGFHNYKSAVLNAYSEIPTEASPDEVNIEVWVSASDEAVWKFSVPLSFIFKDLE